MSTDTTPQAGRALDAEVARVVMGWESKELYDQILNPAFFDDPNEPMYKPVGKTTYLCRPGRLAPGMDPNVIAREQITADLVIGGDQDLPHFSTDISAAWLVVERMRELGYDVTVMTTAKHGVSCEIAKPTWRGSEYEKANTAPLAICFTALAAVQVTE